MAMLSHKHLFLLNTAQTSGSPKLLEIERSEGSYLYSPDGKKYLDLISGFAVSNIGHRHPKVLEAIQDQAGRFLHVTVYGEYVQAPQVKLAEKLLQVLPEPLNAIYYVNSGSEATEGAMKLAKRYTNRSEIIAFKHAYHGSTQGSLSVMGNEHYKQAYRPLLPDIRFIGFNQAKDLKYITENTAAVILETIQGEAGIRVPDATYLQALRKRCTATGTLLILDEIQSGFGRTGRFFAFEHFGIVPDILLLAKGMGGGLPIGAFISSKAIMDSLKENPILGHITTFGGHPLSCAASLATLKVILEEHLMEPIASKEALFRQLLQHPKITEVRGKGLMLGIEIGSFEKVELISKYCQDKGLIIDWFLHCDTAMRIAPPLIISEEEIRWACALILEAVEKA